jgi:Tfp pilus assembly protein PilZ
MQRASGIALAPPRPGKKTAARVALVNIKEPLEALLSDCFKQFGIEAVLMTSDAPERLRKEKFEACVLHLNPAAEAVMDAVRRSPSNSRMVIYGLGGSAQDAMRFSKYGVNAVFHEPLDRPAALKLVRATQMLVLHEFRRYVRIPIITEIAIVTNDGRRFTATSQELSTGGMSVKSAEDVSLGTELEVSFALLTLPRIWVRAEVSWRKPNKTFGVRFEAKDERRFRIKEWIEAYLEN